RLSHSFIHPVVFTSHGPQMTHAQFLTFCVSLAAMLTLFATFYRLELAGKRLHAHLPELPELLAARPARSTAPRRTSSSSSPRSRGGRSSRPRPRASGADPPTT